MRNRTGTIVDISPTLNQYAETINDSQVEAKEADEIEVVDSEEGQGKRQNLLKKVNHQKAQFKVRRRKRRIQDMTVTKKVPLTRM